MAWFVQKKFDSEGDAFCVQRVFALSIDGKKGLSTKSNFSALLVQPDQAR